MKAYNARYQHGFLYDSNTGKRILLAEGSKLTVTIQEQDLLTEDPYNHPIKPDEEEKRRRDLKEKGFTEAVRIKRPKEVLFFEINAGLKSKIHESKSCLFSVEMEEELLGVRKNESKPYELSNCICRVTECLTSNLEFFEPIYAYSLNDAYMKTYDFYFRLYGKPSANVKVRMMERPGGDKKFLKDQLSADRKPDFKFV